jgi:hypothetical protein
MLKRKEKQQKQREGNRAIVDGDPFVIALVFFARKIK